MRQWMGSCGRGKMPASWALIPSLSLCLLNPFPGQGRSLCAEAGPRTAPGYAETAASVFRGPAEGTGCCALLGPEGSAASGP